jgi:hypothetical protein
MSKHPEERRQMIAALRYDDTFVKADGDRESADGIHLQPGGVAPIGP